MAQLLKKTISCVFANESKAQYLCEKGYIETTVGFSLPITADKYTVAGADYSALQVRVNLI